jgi:predicted ATPase
MPEKKPQNIKLRHLEIENFKAIDSLKIDFPAPRMKNDSDVIVLGSKNGVGKTSVLESCALICLAAMLDIEELVDISGIRVPIDVIDLIVRAGSSRSIIKGTFDAGSHKAEVELVLNRNGIVEKIGSKLYFESIHDLIKPDMMERYMFSLVGLNSDPLIYPPLLYFNSYRKVKEGNPELGMIVESGRENRRTRFQPDYKFSISAFKLEILRLMMGKADLFETNEKQAGDSLEKLNELVRSYAGGTIEKLRTSPDNTIEFRISPVNGGESFAFDGLSSGQKEIISTLFLIWQYTKTTPSIILIDEPEMHLNAGWHQDFTYKVTELAPNNQYIFATHSEDVFASVEGDRRIILSSSEDE